MRVHELAKQLNIPSKDLVTRLQEFGLDVKSHMSVLTEDAALEARAKLTGGKAARAAMAAAAAPGSRKPEPPPPEVEEGEAPAAEPRKDDKTLIVKGPVVVREFAEMLNLKPNQLIAELMGMNVFASINEKLEVKIAQQLAKRHGYKVEQEKRKPERKPPPPQKKVEPPPEVTAAEEAGRLVTRPPIVTFLGHVDHGKTSLLDWIRKSKVAAGEDGGITQHIGAYTVPVGKQSITFLDTPGHAAFTAMRARGANLTDIAVIVVAADDGVMPQTREAIQHAKAAGVTILVAVNKVDLPAANPDRVKQQLQAEDVTVEDWGGTVVACPVSAVTGAGMAEMLEMLSLQAEMMELTADPNRSAKGFVIESQLEPGMGPTANLLVRTGTLKLGDSIVCGTAYGRVKALISDSGKKIPTAGPSTPVKCLGLSAVPDAGAEFEVVANPKTAKAIAEEREKVVKASSREAPARKASLDDLLSMTDPTTVLELPVIVKADVQGSIEAIVQALQEIESTKIKLNILLTGVGTVSGNDVLLASASNAIILGFHVGKENAAGAIAKREGVEIRLYNIIYEMIDNVREAMTGMLAPEERESILGQAEIRQVFELSNRGKVAGCMVVRGRIHAHARARLLRGNEVVYEGRLATLRRFQNEANEVREGQECGIRLDNFKAFEVGDLIQTYEVEKIAAAL
jgi:translation initiation factor IF-2